MATSSLPFSEKFKKLLVYLAGFSDSIMEAFPTGTLKTLMRDLKMSNIVQQLPTKVLSSQLFTTLFSLSILTKKDNIPS
jgi:hypothetical protein